MIAFLISLFDNFKVDKKIPIFWDLLGSTTETATGFDSLTLEKFNKLKTSKEIVQTFFFFFFNDFFWK